jgi:hypothetical protein
MVWKKEWGDLQGQSVGVGGQGARDQIVTERT